MPHRALLSAVLLLASASAFADSPYSGEESREIKAVSPQEAADLLAGKGMGLAKAAELNGYPGPKHVLELAARLDLTTVQVAQTEALFRSMQVQAKGIGAQLLEEERSLDRQFASGSVTPVSLRSSLEKIGGLQADLRRVHLEAHLEQAALLSNAQLAAYSKLRGYGARPGESEHSSPNHGH